MRSKSVSCFSIPSSSRSNVDFPSPLRPTTASRSPGSTRNETSRSSVRAPNDFSTRTTSTGSDSSGLASQGSAAHGESGSFGVTTAPSRAARI